MSGRRFALILGFLAASCGPVVAQTMAPVTPPLPPVTLKGAAASPSVSQTPGDASFPPYEPQLDRLAELMGTLAYLRDLCGKGDGNEWRGRMTALMEAEATTALRKDRLAGAYNRGFHGYEITYRTCTSSAEMIILRSLVEGDHLARELGTRFGAG